MSEKKNIQFSSFYLKNHDQQNNDKSFVTNSCQFDGNTSSYVVEVADENGTAIQDGDVSGSSIGHQENESKLEDIEIESNYESEQVLDLCEIIPGLYRLLDLCKDEGSNGLVDKIIISQQHVERLCHELVPNSFKSISKIDYKKLNSKRVRLVGCYGRNEMIANFLLRKNIIDQTTYGWLIASVSSKNAHGVNSINIALRPGIYLLKLPSVEANASNFEHQFLVIHWSEDGCYEDSASSYHKKNLSNIHRYLTKLTENQICVMSETDLDNINWQEDDCDENDICYDFEVKKSQEQKENFELYPGFEIHIPKISTQRNSLTNGGIPSPPLIVESVSNQTLLTREFFPTSKETKEDNKRFDSIEKLREYFKMKLETQKCALHLNRQALKMENLEIIVKDCLNMPELFVPYNDAMKALNIEKSKEIAEAKEPIKKKADIMEKIAWQLLHDSYSRFEERITGVNPGLNPNQTVEPVDDAKLRDEYPHICSEIQAAVKRINNVSWQGIKKRYIFARLCTIYNQTSLNSKGFTLLDIFFDETKDLHSLIKKLIQTGKEGKVKKVINFIIGGKIKKSAYEIFISLDEQEKLISDDVFTRQLIEDNVDMRILLEFFKKYESWRKNIFSSIVKTISQKILSHDYISTRITPIEDKFRLKECDIQSENVKRICTETESKYPNGALFLVLGLEKQQGGLSLNKLYKKFSWLIFFYFQGNWRHAPYKLLRKIETTRPERLRITLFQTQLSEQDTLELERNAFHIPKPILYTHGKNVLIIDPEIFEFRHIAQLGKRFLVFLWNKNLKRLEIYFNTIDRLTETISHQNAIKKINPGEHFMIAVNEPKGLIGIYSAEKGVLNTYSFEQGQTNLHLYYRNIQLLPWYNDAVPDISHFFFIKNTEDICFVERDGRARIYNLVNDSFLPGIIHIPPDAINVRSTPDGTCIVAFVKEEEINDELKITISRQLGRNFESKDEKKVRCYVYFCGNFSQRASKIVDVPFTKSPEIFQFSMFENRQMHLTTIDQEKGIFNSAIVKITHAKTQYCFERQQKSPNKVKVESRQPFVVVGNETYFTRGIHVGDLIVIENEKQQIIEIINNTALRVSSQFVHIEFGVWKKFSIETRTVNGLLDVYSMVFTKYAVTSSIGRVDNNPLSLTVVFERETKKPLGHLEKFNIRFATFQDLHVKNNSNIYELGEWMIDFFCLIPLQIAVTRDNKFIPLQDGLFSSDIEKPSVEEGIGFIGSVSKAISFGWYEAIFEHYAHLKVKVISSMGEQSCGKSYLLNHLLGSTFDGSAMRCTEGVWMSLVITDKILYVALDFEGLASIERTPQEETFLQLLNAALSNLVLFKSQFAVSRDISSMFQRFQDSTNYFRDDPDIFQARFCIIIKDVAKSDHEGIVSEFYSKFSKIVDKEEENNFITKLYRNKMSIIPWPVFNESSFYTTFKQLKMKLDNQDSQYKNAKIFVEKIKVLMTKLKACDWGSVQETLITMRTLELRRLMRNAISQGFEQKEEDPFLSSENITQPAYNIKHLVGRDDGKSILDPESFLSDIFNDIDGPIKLMPDAGLVLLKDDVNLGELSLELRNFFEENIQAREQSSDSRWLDRLETFYKFIIDRRVKRVQQWFAQNTSQFPNDHNEIVIAKYALEQEITHLKLFWHFCRLRCENCGLVCLKASRHNDNEDDATHDCLTDHECYSACQFQETHFDKTMPKCTKFAGHEGCHACSAKHSCEAPCIYNGKRNCQLKCTKDIGHETMTGNEVHLCEATRHYCGAPCSLKADTRNGNYECRNTCIIPCEEFHQVHKCENEVCPIECPIATCRRRCESRKHFHAFEENVEHFCGEEHQCPNECEELGICKIFTEPTAIVKEEAEYVNQFGSFMFTKYSQNAQRLPCCIKIPPYEFKHEGKHVHVHEKMHKCDATCPEDWGEHVKKHNIHFCDVKCPHCAYYCTLPYDHNSEHDTVHGNMYLTTFTCEEEEFEFEGHRLTVGDRGDFVLCHKLCENIGRHRHIDFCKDPAVCKNLPGGKKEGLLEHIEANISPDPARKKDYISHRVFWERTKFRDPYLLSSRENFKGCDHECADEKHHKSIETDPIKSFCTRELFHPGLDPSSNPPENIGYITTDGHHFSCENPATDFHIVFVLDRSSSMSSEDCKPLHQRSTTSRLLRNHQNRLGAVYEAVHTFFRTRKNSGKATRIGAVDRDITSLILFNSVATVVFENQSLSNIEELLNKMMKFTPTGNTSYYEGLKKASEIIEKYHDPKRTNVIIFLSDGLCKTPESELRNLCQREVNKGTPLYLYTVLFNSYAAKSEVDKGYFYNLLNSHNNWNQSLQEMAAIATEYLPQSTGRDALKCKYTLAIDEIELTKYFTKVAESLRKHQPILMRK
ncbi:7794_t:CDS:10 [Ambispora gerdemannii]|uniref:7794_t:CDS:1 n=1 Tax=Ambispora gerdemannii TaxID=144530 RepID=A0A9N8ZMJ3_9GLOM|nr:7794_t:CDS:10 [Ambispora gerdemannii]